MTLSVMAECCCAECHLYRVSSMLTVVNEPFMQSVIILSVFKLSVVMLSVVKLSVVMLSDVMLSVVAPPKSLCFKQQKID